MARLSSRWTSTALLAALWGCTAPTAMPAGETSSDATTDVSTASVGSTSDDDSSPATTTIGSTATSSSSGSGDPTDPTTSTDATGEAGSSSTGDEAGWGSISGDCGLIDASRIDSASPAFFDNAIDFGATGFDYDALTEGGKAVYDADNLGGSSLLSEVAAFEILARCEGAELLETESEIGYDDPMSAKTDFMVRIDGFVVGVSVTRAYAFPPDDPYSEAQATTLLGDKLADILESSASVSAEDAWRKQILHVIAYQDMHLDSVTAAYAGLDAALTADTIVLVSVSDGDDGFLYE